MTVSTATAVAHFPRCRGSTRTAAYSPSAPSARSSRQGYGSATSSRPALVDAYVAARIRSDRGAPQLEQAALAGLIAEGHFFRHIRRTRNLYAERQGQFVELLRRELPGLIDCGPAEAGIHLIGWLPDGTDDREASRLAAPPLRVAAPALSSDAVAAPTRPGLVLGYVAPSSEEMRAGVHDLRVVLRTLERRGQLARAVSGGDQSR